MKNQTILFIALAGLSMILSQNANGEGASPIQVVTVVTSGVRPAPPPGLVISPPAGVLPVPISGVVVPPPLTEHPVFTAELIPIDVDEHGDKTPSGTTLTMNETGEMVSSFLMTREIRPICPPGTMCPMYISLQQLKFQVIKSSESECGSHLYVAQIAETPLSPASNTTAPQRLVVADYRGSDCRTDFRDDWMVTLMQGTSRQEFYGEPEAVP